MDIYRPKVRIVLLVWSVLVGCLRVEIRNQGVGGTLQNTTHNLGN